MKFGAAFGLNTDGGKVLVSAFFSASRGADHRGQIPDRVSLHVRPPEVEDQLVSGHGEGDLIRGAHDCSCVGTLVEHSSRLVMLAHMTGATAQAALEGFASLLHGVPEPMRKSTTYTAAARQ